jgi:hypothetical protein
MTRVARLAIPVALALLTGCAGMRTSPATRYLGIILDARNLGADVLEDAMDDDATLRMYVARSGRPDFVLKATLLDFELFYTAAASRVAYFRRTDEDEPSLVGEVSPMPGQILDLLPADIRAGTPGPPVDEPVDTICWRVPVGDDSCRTCCLSPGACIAECKPPKKK